MICWCPRLRLLSPLLRHFRTHLTPAALSLSRPRRLGRGADAGRDGSSGGLLAAHRRADARRRRGGLRAARRERRRAQAAVQARAARLSRIRRCALGGRARRARERRPGARSARAGTRGAPALLSAKIGASLREADRRRLAVDVEAQLAAEAFACRVGPRRLADPNALRTLREALLAGRMVKFDYGSPPRWRKVVPYGLLFGPRTYLVARTKKGAKPVLFRLDQIVGLEILDEPGAPPPEFDLKAFAGQSFGVFQEPPEEIVLSFAPEAAPDARYRSKWNSRQSGSGGAPFTGTTGAVILSSRSSSTTRLKQQRLAVVSRATLFRDRFYPASAGVGTRPSCSSIISRSNIRLNEACLPSR